MMQTAQGRRNGTPKTCNRCGRSGSHAFRRTADGLYECTTTTACSARARRIAGARADGRGRLPKHRSLSGSAPGVAYVIGPDGPDRELVASTLRGVVGLAIAVGEPTRNSLIALGARNVKLIAVAAECLEPVGFRNEFALRCRQPRLSSVPVFVYGPDRLTATTMRRMPAATTIAYREPDDIPRGMRTQLAALEAKLA